MDVEQALFERLKSQVTLVANRVSAAPAPDSWPVPLVTHQLLTGGLAVCLGGMSDWWQPAFQVTAWAANYEQLMPVVKQIRSALNGWTQVFDGLLVDFSYIETQRDLEDRSFDPPLVGRAFDVTVSCKGGG
jgi:hypothetical protein